MKVDKSLWQQATLGQLFNLYQPKTISTSQLVEDGAYPVFGANGIIGFYNEYNHDDPEVLITCRGASCGSINISKPKSWINGNAMVVHPKDFVNVDISFLSYLAKSIDYSKVITGSAQPQITRANLQNVKIKLPQYIIQKSIASELDALQEVIDGYKAQLTDLDALAQSIFLDTFGDPISNPKGWEVDILKNLAVIGTGSTPSRSNPDYYNGIIPWVKSTEVRNSFISQTQEHINEEAIRNSNCTIYPVNTILIAMYGQGKTRGQVGLLKIEATTNQACAAIQCKSEINYLFAFWHFQMCYEANRSLGHGTNQKNMNLSIVGNMRFILPPLELQNKFAKQVEAIERQKSLLRQQLADAEMLMAERMQYYFS